jgi:hypothetical protein
MSDQQRWIDRPASEELAGLALNRPGSDDWAIALRRFLLNFGLLEAMTYWWIGDLAHDRAIVTVAQDLSFSKRVTLIGRLLDRSLMPDASKSAVRAAWRKASELSRLRNDVAHNPLVSWWSTEVHSRPPDMHGIVPYQRLELGDTGQAPMITLGQVQAAIPESNGVIEELYDRLAELRRMSLAADDGAPTA